MLNKLAQFGAPALTLVLLAGMTSVDRLRIDPHVADAFHARAAAAMAQVPVEIGPWYSAREYPLEKDAEGMLKPNGYLHRLYRNRRDGRQVELLFVQCRDSRDMQGHYPPICYPSHGCTMPLPGEAQLWRAGDLEFAGREYTVTLPSGYKQTIRNFFVLPSGKIERDMESVVAAAKDQQGLVYGVAQIQLLFDASVGEAERDAIFSTVIGANRPLIDALRLAETNSATR